MIFRQFRAEGGCNSFILADPRTKKACLIDPRADEMHNYEAFASEKGLSFSLVVDTHTHADHYSGSHLVARDFGAAIAMSAQTESARAGVKLVDGQTLEVASGIGLSVLETPGHTRDSLSLVAHSSWGDVVFTGDTLFIGGSGRTDFPNADPVAQYQSIHQKLGALNGGVFVLPGHDYAGILFSTIEEEKKTNPHWLLQNVDEFVKLKNAEVLDSGGVLQNIVNFNLNANPSQRPRAGAHTMCATICSQAPSQTKQISVSEFAGILNEGLGPDDLIIDVSETQEFARGSVPGARSIPVGEVLSVCHDLRQASTVYLLCPTGNRSLVAAQSLEKVGVKNPVNIQGGMAAWIAAKNYR